MIGDYTYTINYSSVDYDVNPRKEWSLTQDLVDDDTGAYYYRGKIGSLEFAKDDFSLLKTIFEDSSCVEATITITRVCTSETKTIYSGIFSPVDIDIDYHKCRATLRTEPDDIYRCIYQNWEQDYDILNQATTIIDVTIQQVVDTAEFLVTTTTPPMGQLWTFIDTVTINSTDYHVYGRIVAVTDCDGGNPVEPFGTWQLVEDNCAIDSTAKYATAIPDTSLYTVNYGATPPAGSIVVAENVEFSGIEIWVIDNTTTVDTSINNGRSMNDVIEFLVGESCGTINEVKSEIFQLNPDTTTEELYVTGASNPYRQTMVWQITDITNNDADSNASIGLMNLKELLSDLYKMMNLRWRIEGTDLRIDHISYFTQNVGTDISANDQFRVVKQDKQEIPSRIKYSSLVQRNTDFVGRDIEYPAACSGDEIQEVRLKYFTADMSFLLNFPEDITTEGFVIAHYYEDTGEYFVGQAPGALSLVTVNNAEYSWANLHDKLHRHHAHYNTGTLNGQSITFDSTRKTKTQEVRYNNCCFDIDPNDLFKTSIGEGVVKRMVTPNITQRATITLGQ